MKPCVSKKLRDSARGQECTMGIPGICNGNNETVVLCHVPMAPWNGMGCKPSDYMAFYGCSGCHYWFDTDGRGDPLRWEYAIRAVFKTLEKAYESGILTIKGDKNGKYYK